MDTLRPLLCRARPLALALALFAAAGGAHAESPTATATDDAFGALLAMPGAQPKEGGWIVPQEAAKDETELVARLQELKKAGARFDAVRHGGTLLAHAIRAGKDRTALWLLRNGADPRKVLAKGDENADDLARRYQRTSVVAVLERRYGLRPTSPVVATRKPRAAQAAVPATAPQTRAQQAAVMLQRLSSPAMQGGATAGTRAVQAWRQWASTLSQEEFVSIFESGDSFGSLVDLDWKTGGAVQEALARLPSELVRRHAQRIADSLAHWSFVTYAAEPRIEYTGASRSWPALWRHLDRPLRYDHDRATVLAGSIPPALWPGLFASGYANHESGSTGCLLAAVDLPQLQALWPEFERDFADARDEAAGLVLGAYRIDRERSPCYYGSSPSDTAAKLAFLRAQGVVGPVYGLRPRNLNEPAEPALAAMLQAFAPTQAVMPRLVAVAPNCELAPDERWLDALVKAGPVGWGVAPSGVQLVELSGRADCGLLVSGDSFLDWPSITDDFDAGPSREPPTSPCADAPDDGEIWALDRDGIQHVEAVTPSRGSGARLRKVRDLATGKDYVFDRGQTGAMCNLFHGLPRAFEWRAGAKGPALVPSADGELLDRLLRRQCQQSDDTTDVDCTGIDEAEAPVTEGRPTQSRLREGRTVTLRDMVDLLGTGRRAAWRSALAAHDHAALRRLLAIGIPNWWTAAEIQALATSAMPLEEKRRRIALLFADPAQLAGALKVDGSSVASSLGAWLPRQDWAPILRLVAANPADWFDARQRFGAPAHSALGCDLDHAQGFVCGGGLQPD